MARLNLGSGGLPRVGYINVDKRASMPGVNAVIDLDHYPWPFADGSVDEVAMEHCLEHLVDSNRAMGEVYRILKTGGKAVITVPHFTWQYAYADPTHRHFYAYRTFFSYVNKHGYFDFAFSSCAVKLIFGKRLSVWNIVLEPLFNMIPDVYEQSPLRIFPALHVRAVLIK